MLLLRSGLKPPADRFMGQLSFLGVQFFESFERPNPEFSDGF